MTKLEVTAKNSKSEILEAYENAMRVLEEVKRDNKQEAKREQEKKTLITAASSNTAASIVQELADLKLAIVKSLETVENDLLVEHKKLKTLQEAIQLQEQDLDDLHQIKMNVNAFAALLQAQREKKEAFEQEMAQQKLAWQKEQDEVMHAWKEQEMLQKKLRQREEEDYVYKRDLERTKEQDSYTMQKQVLEKELLDKKQALEHEFASREAAIVAKEQELQSLRLQAAEAPKRLEKALQDTEKAVTEKLQFKYEYEAKLTHQAVEGEKKLSQQMISSLELKIKQQEQQIKELTEKANQAGLQVQQIAVKAIESTAGPRFGYPNIDKISDSIKDKN